MNRNERRAASAARLKKERAYDETHAPFSARWHGVFNADGTLCFRTLAFQLRTDARRDFPHDHHKVVHEYVYLPTGAPFVMVSVGFAL